MTACGQCDRGRQVRSGACIQGGRDRRGHSGAFARRLFPGGAPADRRAVSSTQAFFGAAEYRPFSDASAGPGKSSVLRHAVACTRLPYVLAESGAIG